MTGSKSHNAFEVWLLMLTICLTGCEYDSSPVEPEPDYTGLKGTVMDIDSNIYQTIGIGKQIWMAENLAATRLNDGTELPEVTVNTEWGSFIKPAYCLYNSSKFDYKNVFGLLYNYHAVITGQLCPSGWHVPSAVEWAELVKFAGGKEKAGGKLKMLNSPLWDVTNYCFEENYEFNAIPGGCRRQSWNSSWFENLGVTGYWWSKDSLDYFDAQAVSMKGENTSLNTNYYRKRSGFSVRCLKD